MHNTRRRIGSTLDVALLGFLVQATGSAHAATTSEFLTGVRTAMFFCAVLLLVCGAVVILFR